VFDSGVGGLSVLAELHKLAPQHPIYYLADQAWAPYGERSLAAVRSRAVAVTEFLRTKGCELVVVACNSASAAALHHLRAVFPEMRFVGMEPAVKPAAHQSRRGIIGVLATSATFQGELYASVVDRHANGAEVVEQACPGLAEAVERLGVADPGTIELVRRYVGPLRDAGIDTLVLGCTHYPFVLEAIEAAAGEGVTVIDPSPAVARQTLRLLGQPDGRGTTEYLTTGDAAFLAQQIEALLGVTALPRAVEIGVDEADVNGAVVRVIVGDLTAQDVDAIVNAGNTALQHGGGVAGAIVRAGGAVIQEESNDWVRRHGRLGPGEAAVTTAGAMPAGYVVHVAGPIYQSGRDNAGLLREAVRGALEAAAAIGALSIAFPAISAGIFGYPVAEATAVLTDEVVDWLAERSGAMKEVRLVGFDAAAAEHFRYGLARAVASR
jgi:glutamate racemase